MNFSRRHLLASLGLALPTVAILATEANATTSTTTTKKHKPAKHTASQKPHKASKHTASQTPHKSHKSTAKPAVQG